LFGAVAKPASINLRKLVLCPTGLINLGFILREDLLLCSSYLSLGVPNWAVIYTPSGTYRHINRVAGGELCSVHLDMAVATAPWSALYLLATLRHLTRVTSDDSLILLCWRELAKQHRVNSDKIFWYEIMWEKREQFNPFPFDAWQAKGKALPCNN
jgi:hypothetical protein